MLEASAGFTDNDSGSAFSEVTMLLREREALARQTMDQVSGDAIISKGSIVVLKGRSVELSDRTAVLMGLRED